MLQKDGVAPYKFFACLLQAHFSVMRCCNNVLVTLETDRKAHSLEVRDAILSILLLLDILKQNSVERYPRNQGHKINFSTNKGKIYPCDEAPLHEKL